MPTKPKTHRPPHQQTRQEQRASKVKNPLYDAAWNNLSKQYRLEHPSCERCLAEGVITFEILVHHKQPITAKPELRLAWDNLESVCARHHAIAHQELGEELPHNKGKKTE